MRMGERLLPSSHMARLGERLFFPLIGVLRACNASHRTTAEVPRQLAIQCSPVSYHIFRSFYASRKPIRSSNRIVSIFPSLHILPG